MAADDWIKVPPAFPLGLRLYHEWRGPSGSTLSSAHSTVVAHVPPFREPWNENWYGGFRACLPGLDVPPFNEPPRAKPCWQYVLMLDASSGSGFLVWPHWRPTMMAGKACEEGQCKYHVPKKDVIALRQALFTYAEPARWQSDRVLVLAADQADFDRYVARYRDRPEEDKLHLFVGDPSSLKGAPSANLAPVVYTPRAVENPDFSLIDHTVRQQRRLILLAANEECIYMPGLDTETDLQKARSAHDTIVGLEAERDTAVRQVAAAHRQRDALIEVLKDYARSCQHANGPDCHCTRRASTTLDLLGVSYDR